MIKTIQLAKKRKSKIISIVGKPDGYAAKYSDITIKVNVDNNKLVTPISESMQALIWHAIVSDPRLQLNKTTW